VNDVGGINHMKRSVQYGRRKKFFGSADERFNFARFCYVLYIATVHNPAKFWISLGNPILVRQYGEQLIRIKGPGDIDPA
jgi:hypothetical protein